MTLTVLQALPALEVGGVERGTLEVADALVAAGHRSLVVSAGGRLVEKLSAGGSEHITLPIGKKSPSTLRYILFLRQLLTQQPVDIVHARSRLPAWICRLAINTLPANDRPRFVTTVHGPYSVNRYSRIMCQGDSVIAISEFIREYILDNYPQTPADKVRVIHRGVSSSEFPHGYRPDADWRSQWRSTHPEMENRFLITAPARLTRWKGQEDFIHIVHGLKEQGIPVHGLIAGGAEARRQSFLEELQQLVSRLNLENDVSFLGHRDDLKAIMAISDVVLSLAREPEAFGRTALEALCLGIPVIAYDHGGAAEVLGRMFPEGRIEPLNIGQAVARAADFYRTPPPVPDNNVFTRRRMLEETLQLYEEAAAQR